MPIIAEAALTIAGMLALAVIVGAVFARRDTAPEQSQIRVYPSMPNRRHPGHSIERARRTVTAAGPEGVDTARRGAA